MRLGATGYLDAGNWTVGLNEPIDEIEEKASAYGLSAIRVPQEVYDADASDEELIEYAERLRDAGFRICETGYVRSLIHADKDVRQERISEIREILRKADLMEVDWVCTVIGSRATFGDYPMLAPHSYNYTEDCREEIKQTCRQIFDGLNLDHTKFGLEPFPNSFFFEPEEIRAFFDDMDIPHLGFHCDIANMVDHRNYFHTTELIEETFELLGDEIIGIHLSEIRWDENHLHIKFDEPPEPGTGIMDFHTLLQKIDRELPKEQCCLVQHQPTEEQYAKAFPRIHTIADDAGAEIKTL